MSKRARHTPALVGEKKIRVMSLDVALFPHVGDAITQLSKTNAWKEVEDTVEEIVAACKDFIEYWYSDMLIGSVFPWIITPPAGWLLLDGSTHASADYPELSALLPTHLISGANFILPDVDEAFSFGVVDEGAGAIVAGSNVLTLTIAQLPGHTHTEIPPIIGATVGGAGPPLPSSTVGAPIASGSAGSGDDIDTRPKRFGLIYAVFAGRE